ncbi:MAG TPA: DUF4199 domain-containing protein [Flavitalea sp.]|nr:DUF4199 domain-containing protein [Flavitalea sp.]
MEQKVTTHITKGIIISLILLVISLAAHFTNQSDAAWAKWTPSILLCAGVIWACINYSNQRNHNVTFGNVFAHGFKVSAVATVFSIIFSVIFLLLFPEVKEKAIETARQQMEANPQVSSDQINQAMAMTDRLFYVFLIGGIILIYLIIGCISSLIGAAVAKKDPRGPFETNSNV